MARMAQDLDLASGILRGVTGPLVKVPVSSIAFTSSGASLSLGNNAFNPDGSTAVLPLSAAAGPPNGAWMSTVLSGRVVGVRWRRDSGATPFFDVVIDGVAYRVEDTNPRLDNVLAGGITDYETTYIVASGLPDKRHTVTVIVPCDKAGGSTRVLNFLGFVVERGRGYNELDPVPRGGLTPAPTTLTASAASVPYQTPLVGLRFRNNDVAARTVTVYGSDGTSVYATVALAAGEDKALTLPSARMVSGWKWKADAAGVVIGWAENA